MDDVGQEVSHRYGSSPADIPRHQRIISAKDFKTPFLHGEYDDVLQNTHDPSQKGKFWPWVKAKLAELNAAQEFIGGNWGSYGGGCYGEIF